MRELYKEWMQFSHPQSVRYGRMMADSIFAGLPNNLLYRSCPLVGVITATRLTAHSAHIRVNDS